MIDWEDDWSKASYIHAVIQVRKDVRENVGIHIHRDRRMMAQIRDSITHGIRDQLWMHSYERVVAIRAWESVVMPVRDRIINQVWHQCFSSPRRLYLETRLTSDWEFLMIKRPLVNQLEAHLNDWTFKERDGTLDFQVLLTST